MPDKALRLLQQQHREVEKLFKQIEGSEEPQTRRELCEQIVQKLKLHTTIEERVFYPALRERGPAKAEEMVLEALEEHHVVDLVLKEIPRLDPEDERFHAKMTVLHELVRHHVEEEEKEMFKLAERLGKEELDHLGDEIRAEMPSTGA